MDRVLIALFIAVLVLVALGSENGALDEPFLMERLDGSSAPPLQGSTSYATSSYPSSKLDRTSRKLESGSPKDGSFNGGATARNTMVGQIETTQVERVEKSEERNTFLKPLTRFGSSVNEEEGSKSIDTATDEKLASRELLLNYVFFSQTTNQSFSDDLCDGRLLNATTLELSMNGIRSYFLVPDCLANSSLEVLDGSNLLIPSLIVIPVSVYSWTCFNCKFGPVETGIVPSLRIGFQPNGNIEWPDVWSYFPSLGVLIWQRSFLRGALPTSIPPTVSTFRLDDNAYSLGNIAPGLFAFSSSGHAPSAFIFSCSGCGLTGSIPPALLSSFAGVQIQTLFELNLSNNNLSGTIASNFFSPLSSANLEVFTLDLTNNKLSGPITNQLCPIGMLSSNAPMLYIDLAANRFNGTIPNELFACLNNASSLTFKAAWNEFSGDLPPALFTGSGWSSSAALYLDLSNNRLTGALPALLIASSLRSSNASISSLRIFLNQNFLSSLPSTFFRSNGGFALSVSSCIIDLSGNVLSGTVSPNLMDGVQRANANVQLFMTDNALSGTFPNPFFDYSRMAGGSLSVSAQNNLLKGNAPTACNHLNSASYHFNNNLLDGSIPLPYTSLPCANLILSLEDNLKLSGAIPPAIFNVSYFTLRAFNTNLSGLIPPIVTSQFGLIYLSDTAIDFCTHPLIDNTSSTVFTPARCVLSNTRAACECPQHYGECVLDCAPISPLPPIPTSQSAPSACDPKTRPSPEFTCRNGIWTATSTSGPVLTIPAGAGVVVVEGNVSSSTIIINGIGSKIIIEGCSTNLSSIVIELSPEQVKQLETNKSLQTLLTLLNRTGCNSDLNGVALSTKTSGCRKVETRKAVTENGSTLGAYFVVTSRGCNTWWIVLVSVIVVVVILGTIAAIVTGVLLKRHQEKKHFDRLETGSASQEANHQSSQSKSKQMLQ